MGKIVKYMPAIIAVIKLIWSMYKQKVRADGYKEALKQEQHKRVKAEAKVVLRDRLDDSDAVRMERLRREAADRSSEGTD